MNWRHQTRWTKSLTRYGAISESSLIIYYIHDHYEGPHIYNVLKVLELNPDTALIRTDHGKVDVNVLTDIESKYADGMEMDTNQHADHHSNEVEVLCLERSKDKPFDKESFEGALSCLDQDTFFRVKGFVWMQHGGGTDMQVLNFAFKRWAWHCDHDSDEHSHSRITFMGKGIHARRRWLASKLKLESFEELKKI